VVLNYRWEMDRAIALRSHLPNYTCSRSAQIPFITPFGGA